MNAYEAINKIIDLEKQIRSPCCGAPVEFWMNDGFPAFVISADSARCTKCGRRYYRQEFDWKEATDGKEKKNE